VFCRFISQLVDTNTQSSVGKFNIHVVLHYFCCSIAAALFIGGALFVFYTISKFCLTILYRTLM